MSKIKREKSKMELWAENEVKIACHRKGDEFDYGCASYESALKAFKTLCKDGHSGASIMFTKAILNRMIKIAENMWREELILNKIFAIIMILIGALLVPVEWDATFFLFTLIVGGYLFFAKRNWIVL